MSKTFSIRLNTNTRFRYGLQSWIMRNVVSLMYDFCLFITFDTSCPLLFWNIRRNRNFKLTPCGICGSSSSYWLWFFYVRDWFFVLLFSRSFCTFCAWFLWCGGYDRFRVFFDNLQRLGDSFLDRNIFLFFPRLWCMTFNWRFRCVILFVFLRLYKS